MVVSGTTKEGDWKETHTSALPDMFKVQRRIFAEQLELRFKVDGTPDKHTLLALKLDPSVNTTQEDGIFSKRTAAQRWLVSTVVSWYVGTSSWSRLLAWQDQRVLLRSSLQSVWRNNVNTGETM
jgi:hypothetical protein